VGGYLVIVRSGLFTSRQVDSNDPTIHLTEENK
jgi:hypothetical protein